MKLSSHLSRFYGKANPLKKTNPSQKLAAPQKQRLLSRKKVDTPKKFGSTHQRNEVDIGEYLRRKTAPIAFNPDPHIDNRFNLSNINRIKGLNVVDIAKTWTMYKRKTLHQRTKAEYEIALSRDRALLALNQISRKLAAISLIHDYSSPPTNRRMATLTKPLRLPFTY